MKKFKEFMTEVKADPTIKVVGSIVAKANTFLNLRKPLEARFGKKNVDFNTNPIPMWTIQTKEGKTVGIVNRKYVDKPELVVTVKTTNIAIGYM